MGSLTDEQNLSFEYTVVFMTFSFISAPSAEEVGFLHQFCIVRFCFLICFSDW